MVEFFPDLDFIENKLRPRPTEGEKFLLNFLSDYLGHLNGKFEVYFQGNLIGKFPDIVILRKGHGALIIEVKDYNLDVYSKKSDDIWIVRTGNGKSIEIKSPTAQVNSYKKLFYDTYSLTLAKKFLRDRKYYSIISCAVFFYGENKDSVSNFFGVIPSPNKEKPVISKDGTILLTSDYLEEFKFNKLPYADFFIGFKTSKYFTDEIYHELHRTLSPSEHTLMKHEFKNLSKKQSELSKSESCKKTKIRGVAGCGKTFVMAHRAVNAYKRTNMLVIILTFNITLRNYICDCISLALGDIPEKKNSSPGIFHS